MDKIRSLLQSEMMVSGLRWWKWRWREVDRLERYLELKRFINLKDFLVVFVERINNGLNNKFEEIK